MKEKRFFQSPTSKQVMLEMSAPYVDQQEDGLVLLRPNSTKASAGTHMPSAQYYSNSMLLVCVGEEAHPMTEEHHIQWIYLHAAMGGQLRVLHPTSTPEAEFPLCNDKVYGVYAYCNLHGLWRLKESEITNTQHIAGEVSQAVAPRTGRGAH